VTQAVGLSRPETSAVAPGGVDTIEMLSVVPRVADAQPRHGVTIAAAKSSLMIIDFVPPRGTFMQLSREINRLFANLQR
jgi:hypothetical protein